MQSDMQLQRDIEAELESEPSIDAHEIRVSVKNGSTSLTKSTTQFKRGDVLFRQGDASDRVLRVRSGEIEVLREVGAASVLLGRVRDCEWLGEMDVIENRARSATARAAADGEVEVLTARQFVERVSSDPVLARDLILRLSIRLRRVEDKIAGDLMIVAHDRPLDEPVEIASDMVIADDATILLFAQTDALRARIGAAPIHVVKLPFLVGRAAVKGEAEPLRRPDLVIADEEPFRLSRQHFMIARSGDRLLVSDLGTLGTIVNGRAIGHHFMKDAAPLHRGENHVLAGGWDSPFEFIISVR
jgi:CRP/FNR family transcriptional regulator, cyclic AMP receptor protein